MKSPFHFGPATRALFGWYHPPRAEVSLGVGIVLCNTLGKESIGAAPRILLLLAERLAEAGFAVLRFDFYGTGDSAGDSSGKDGGSDRVATWLEDIDLAIEELRARGAIGKIGLVGLRLGGTLAMAAAARRCDVDSLVLWNPYFNGKKYVTETTRQHKAFEALLDVPRKLKEIEVDGREALGFFLSAATLAELEKIDLLALGGSPARRVLVISPGGGTQNREGNALIDGLRAIGTDSDHQILDNSLNRTIQLLEPRDRERITEKIATWIAAHYGTAEMTAMPSPASSRPAVSASTHEEPFLFGEGDSLFGILTSPAGGVRSGGRPAIITAVNRLGPHRLYVRMAREWAKLGFPVFRVDLTGSGDSVRAGEVEQDPYPRRAISDLQEAMTLLNKRFSVNRFIIAGICSGADIAFQAGIRDHRVIGTVLMNPRSFSLHNIPALETLVRAHQVETTVLAAKTWRKLLRGAFTLGDVKVKIAEFATAAKLRVRLKLTAPAVGDVSTGFRQLAQRGVDTLLVVRERDVGVSYVDIHFGRQMRALERLKGYRRIDLKDVDHLFTSLYAQDLVLKTITEHLTRHHPAS